MMIRNLTLSLAVVCHALSQTTFAATPGKDAAGVLLFDKENCLGPQCPVGYQNIPDMDRIGFGDKAHSLTWINPPGRCIVLFNEKNYRGAALILTSPRGQINDLDPLDCEDDIDSIGYYTLEQVNQFPARIPRR